MVIVKRALLSCHDKTGLDVLARALAALGVELVASDGTAEFLAKQGLGVKRVEEFTGVSEQLDGRVKTLHPKIHAGILARRDDAAHVTAVGAGGLIDLVVVNLYPFERTARQPGCSLEEAVEQIDVGGVALLRAAAKNCAHVAAVCRPQQYATVADALQRGKGQLPLSVSRQLAQAAFRLTSAYDAAIASYLSAGEASETREDFPEEATITLRRRQPLRYGENPHQRSAWYVPAPEAAWGVGTLTQLQGKELSYNNLLDLDAALRCLLEFDGPACVIIKHHAPCGLAGASTMEQAYARAYACDPESAFGGVIGCNRPIEAAMAASLTAQFVELIMAPSVGPDAAEAFRRKPNVRVVTLEWPARAPAAIEWRHLLGSWLAQEPDAAPVAAEALRVATTRAPTPTEREDLLFAWKAAKHAASNAIVIAQDVATVGIGQGQPSRVGSVRLALEKAASRSRHAVAASDGFFPFPDGIELLAQAGITAVIQPGGSIRDEEVVAAANRAGLAMVLTGVRHFRH